MVGRNYDNELGLGDGASTVVNAYECGIAPFEFDATPVAPESVLVSTYQNVEAVVNVDATLQLQAIVMPESVNQDVIWTVTSGIEFASVNDFGVVTGIAPGITIIRATTVADAMIYGEIEVEVNEVIASNENFEKEKVTIYPNPATDTITLSSEDAIINAQLYDFSGKRVASFKGDTFDISHLNPGVYQAKIQFVNGNQAFVKIVKK